MNAVPTAYCGPPPNPAGWVGNWNWDPVLIVLILAGLLATRRMEPLARPYFSAVLATVALLYLTPLCALGSALFSARVAHHIALSVIVAPLLVASFPKARFPCGVALATGLQAFTLWAWHTPPAYAFALSSSAAYWAMQISLTATAFAFWVSIRRSSLLVGITALLLTMVQMGLLGALITFAPQPLYAPHLLTTAAWSLTPLEDQQLGGLIMWAPAALVYLAAALMIGWRALPERPATI